MIVTLLIVTLGGLARTFATSHKMMWWQRGIQGVALGGEVPLMAAHIDEFAKVPERGQFSLSIQALFAIGCRSAPRWTSTSFRIGADSGCSRSASSPRWT